MTAEQQVFALTLVQVLPALLIALGVFHLGQTERPEADRAKAYVRWAWLLYFGLPVVAEVGLLAALYGSALGADVAGWLAWLMPIALASAALITLAVAGFVVNVFAQKARRP